MQTLSLVVILMASPVDLLKAGRFFFSPEDEYVGKLIAVTKRPIENSDDNVWLLRLEFEIFRLSDENPQESFLLPAGGVASRDIVVTPDAPADDGLMQYAECLRVRRPDILQNWYKLERLVQSKSRRAERWIRIRFGPPDTEIDFRQPFLDIAPFAAPGSKRMRRASTTAVVRPARLKVSEICRLLRDRRNRHPSQDTVNRFVDRHAEQYGEKLVRFTEGGQRRINWYLCWHLWEAARLM